MIIWWSKHVGVILSVLVCDIWINVLLQTSALVGPLYIVFLTYCFKHAHNFWMPYTSCSSTVLIHHTALCIPRKFFVLWDVKFVTTDCVLSQLNAFHITTFYFHCAFKYYLHLGLPSGLFPSVFCASTHPRYVSPPAHPPLFDITNSNTSEVYY
jgi:hypothetical protein